MHRVPVRIAVPARGRCAGRRSALPLAAFLVAVLPFPAAAVDTEVVGQFDRVVLAALPAGATVDAGAPAAIVWITPDGERIEVSTGTVARVVADRIAEIEVDDPGLSLIGMRAEIAASAATAAAATAAATTAAAAALPARAKLSAEQRRAVQAALNRLGFDAGTVDGLFGARTRAAIRAWQQRRGEPATGALTAGEARLLLEPAPAGKGS